MLKRLKVLSIAAVTATLIAGAADAAPVIDFATGLSGVSGSISGAGQSVIGSNIAIGRVTVDGAPQNNGVYSVFGSVNNASVPGNFGSLDFNNTPGNNFITIAGCIPGLGIGTLVNGACSSVSTLMQGTIDSFLNIGDQFLLVFGTDIKNADLLAAMGLPANTPFEFGGSIITNGPFSPTVSAQSISSDILNTAVPEPATMVLIGTGLLAALGARRRQQA